MRTVTTFFGVSPYTDRVENKSSQPKAVTSEDAAIVQEKEETTKSPLERLTGTIGNFWQLITAIVGIATLVVAGLTYFATRQQLSQLDCLTHVSLTMTTAPIERDELTIQIDLAQKDLLLAKPDSIEAVRLKSSIEELVARKQKRGEDLEDAIKKAQQRVCDSTNSNPPDKKP